MIMCAMVMMTLMTTLMMVIVLIIMVLRLMNGGADIDDHGCGVDGDDKDDVGVDDNVDAFGVNDADHADDDRQHQRQQHYLRRRQH